MKNVGVTPKPFSLERPASTSTPDNLESSRIAAEYLSAIDLLSSAPTEREARCSLIVAINAASSGTNTNPGLVQNCPEPNSAESTKPLASTSERSAIAPDVIKRGFRLPISA